MAQNLVIANAAYSDVSAVDITKVGGGFARFTDTSGDTVIAESLVSGYAAHGADGAAVTGSFNPLAGGDYNIVSTDNGDGTQSLAITDATAPDYVKVLASVPQTKDTSLIIVNGEYYAWRD